MRSLTLPSNIRKRREQIEIQSQQIKQKKIDKQVELDKLLIVKEYLKERIKNIQKIINKNSLLLNSNNLNENINLNPIRNNIREYQNMRKIYGLELIYIDEEIQKIQLFLNPPHLPEVETNINHLGGKKQKTKSKK